jgi:putative heme transporter
MMKGGWRALKWLAIVVGLAVIIVGLRDRLPAPSRIAESLAVADVGWLIVALAAELISMTMFARQQRRLLTAFGVTIPRHRALALAYSRSAISISVPAGSAVSAAYAFRQYRIDGVSRRSAATVMVLSGLLSTGALVLLYVTGVLAAGAVRLAEAWRAQPALIDASLAMTLGLLLLIAFLAWPATRTFQGPTQRRRGGGLARLSARAPWLARLITPVLDAVRSSRAVPRRDWALALAAATANWATDLLCLAAAARAFHLPLGLVELAAIYLTVQVVRQIPITPGGIGVIEMSLLAGLLLAGASEAPAAATVLAYRLLSCWLIIPMGLIGWLILRHGNRPLDLNPALATK